MGLTPFVTLWHAISRTPTADQQREGFARKCGSKKTSQYIVIYTSLSVSTLRRTMELSTRSAPEFVFYFNSHLK